ncbi:DEAD/DEAH box helicase [Candidatus Liberibacter americanus]|uniref:Superfamily II DNA/RNA helicase n=1 Tax=Candidatus Liberibacter americanus str. Sao Paulo TaxID=1261131 RepID=U6B515_9HYPH|nr:DEAD/DEAH box helicase [Candidatus Liberibacter americanus]AHA27995.1 Superfamily II DNA/RNA helicase [Candidatus Liberibacter americanus str. Sao Paulo]AHA28035.1 Superfamily II DNA/RNA helicase [Candidatus Liberibacter americanus str. Sao Paulo]EMS35786.1 SNF2 related protein [Candidatus Liberibacter americanus PW_SP]
MLLNLAPHQNKMVDWILTHRRCALWASMGSGKTASVLFALSVIRITDPSPTLVIAPLRVASLVWGEEVKRWSAFSDMRVSTIIGSEKQRIKALNTPAEIYTINFENLPWLIKYHFKTWRFATIVVDESTRLKSFRTHQGTKQTRALGKVAFSKVERFIELTGTPSPNGLIDLWGQLWFLDKGERLGRVYRVFTSRWFNSVQVGSHVGAVKHIAHDTSQKEIEDKLSDCCLSLNIADYQDIDKPIKSVHRIELPKKALALYQRFQKEMFCEIQESTIEAFNPASKTVKCLQLANGAFYVDENKNWQEVHDVKIKMLESIVSEANGSPILVAYHFNSDLSRLQKAFPFARKLDQNPQTVIDWNNGDISLLLAHPASCGHGLNLQYGGNILVFFSLWWDLEQHLQIIERIGNTRQKQAGLNRAVFIHYLIARNTIDEIVLKRLQTKASIQDLLLEALKQETK